ncbi:MAG: TonB-dependent receptor, partial [Burkholderiales bacterium]
TYGAELWGSYRVYEWWRLSAGYNLLKEHLRFKPGSTDTATQNAGNDPAHQFSLRSTMNLRHNVEFDITLRSIAALPNPNVPGYVTADARLGWIIAKGVELSLTGVNLLGKRHPEFGTVATRSELERAFYAKLLWNF